MQAIPVPVAAEMLIIKTLRARAGLAQAPITEIALFAHAFDPAQVMFGSARVAGALTALPPALLDALRPLIRDAARAQTLRAAMVAMVQRPGASVPRA
jgi:hypothetical protein